MQGFGTKLARDSTSGSPSTAARSTTAFRGPGPSSKRRNSAGKGQTPLTASAAASPRTTPPISYSTAPASTQRESAPSAPSPPSTAFSSSRMPCCSPSSTAPASSSGTRLSGRNDHHHKGVPGQSPGLESVVGKGSGDVGGGEEFGGVQHVQALRRQVHQRDLPGKTHSPGYEMGPGPWISERGLA